MTQINFYVLNYIFINQKEAQILKVHVFAKVRVTPQAEEKNASSLTERQPLAKSQSGLLCGGYAVGKQITLLVLVTSFSQVGKGPR